MRQSLAGFCEERDGRFAKVSNRFQFRLLFSLKKSLHSITDPVSRDSNEMKSKYSLNLKDIGKYHFGFLIYSLPLAALGTSGAFSLFSVPIIYSFVQSTNIF